MRVTRAAQSVGQRVVSWTTAAANDAQGYFKGDIKEIIVYNRAVESSYAASLCVWPAAAAPAASVGMSTPLMFVPVLLTGTPRCPT